MQEIKYWRKSYPVGAVRITGHNIQELADHIGGEVVGALGEHRLLFGNEIASIGDWCVFIAGLHLFFTNENFVRKFQTHPETMAENEQYANVFQLVRGAMLKQDSATFHGESSEGMDLVAIETTKKILGQL